MNEIIKGIVIFAVGGAVGSGVTALLLTKKIVKREQSRADEKIKSHDEYLKELENRLFKAEKALRGQYSGEEEAGNDTNAERDVNHGVKHDKTGKNEENSGLKEPKKDENGRYIPVVDYTAFYHGPEDSEHPGERAGEELEKALEDKNEVMNDPERSKMSPKIIKGSEYWDPEYEYHDKITLMYYTEDEILATEEDEIIEDVYLHVGDALTKYGFSKNNDKVIYVRNWNLAVDYEIDKIWGAYSDR